MPLIKCKECGRDMSSSANRCPNCNRYHWTLGRKLILVVPFLMLLFWIFFFVYAVCAG
jgi:hypothetical protein